MSGSFFRRTTFHGLLRSHPSPTTTTTITHSILKHPTTTTTSTAESRGSYCRFSRFFKKSTRECDGVSPPPFTYPLSSSSSSPASISKVRLVGWYLGMLKSKPILTKSITSSCIYIAADLSSQTIALPDSEPYDLVRTSRMAGYGLLVLGPSVHFWFNFMSKLFPKRDLVTTFKKIFMGQTLYGPFMTTVFFSSNAWLQGENSAEIVARLKRDLPPTFMNGVMYWPVCDFITFKFIPVHLQPLVSNSFSYIWTVYMTYMASRKKVKAAS